MDDKVYTLEELEKELSTKQRVFCHEYIKDYNASRAVRDAGYSAKTASVIGHQNLAKVKIKQYIAYIKEDIAREVGISKISLINELKLLAFSNLPSIIEKYKEGGIEALTEEEQRAISEYHEQERKIGEDGAIIDKTLKLKLHDKRAAIQDILKAMGWNEPDKIEHSGEVDVNIEPKKWV